jgi:AmmeMemoRadiSam system protein A
VRLNSAERSVLLRLARVAIRDALLGDGSLREELDRTEITEPLRAKRGMFVTLKSISSPDAHGAPGLRGCIGTLKAAKTLVDTLVDTAPLAALEDPRFPPLTQPEFDEVRISISILTPMQPLVKIETLVPGKHGVQLTRGTRRAVFLPQVAAEQGWNIEQWLRNLALKAGLDAEGWRSAELSIFETEGFGEG